MTDELRQDADEARAVHERFLRVRDAVHEAEHRRGPGRSVRLVGVSKFQPQAKLRAAYDAGLRDFGENYVQELVEKQTRAREDGSLSDATWHFIGRIQRNKIRGMLDCDFIHTVDRSEVVHELDRRAKATGRHIRCMVEVNCGEDQKAGISFEQVGRFLDEFAACTQVSCCGLMVIPPDVSASEARRYFAQVREAAAVHSQNRRPNVDLRELSMGMSGDYAEAILEGATMVRIGTAIFGARA